MAGKRGPKPVGADAKVVGTNLRVARRMIGVSQERLADELGVSRQQIEHYEKGLNRIPVRRAQEACEFLGVTISYLWHGPAVFGDVGLKDFQIARILMSLPNAQWEKIVADVGQLSANVDSKHHKQAWDSFVRTVQSAREERSRSAAVKCK